MQKKDIYLLLKSINGVTNKVVNLIENQVENIDELINFSDKDIFNLKNINTKVKENIVKYKSLTYLDNIKEDLYKKNIQYICYKDEKYPQNLINIHDVPKILFYKGNIDATKGITLGMVGSRKCSDYGKYNAINISKKLSDYGINIISGLAYGIDSYSHEGCISGKSKTIAVLPSSVDNPLPKSSIKIANKILDDDGVLISEYFPNDAVYKSNFYARNRIISGISDGIIVVEASKESGALITVEYALEQGKNIFSIPGNINSYMSKGCNKIIKEGAKLVDEIEDILNEYKIISIKDKENCKNYDKIKLNNDSIKVIDTIKINGLLHIDEICDNTKLEVKHLNTILSELVLNDILIERNNKKYSLNV